MTVSVRKAAKQMLKQTGVGQRMLQLYRATTLRPYLSSIGWMQSMDGQAIDAKGEPVPWYTYPSIAFLDGKVKPELAIFEFGSGNSTLWWSSRVARVVSLEHDKEWYEKLVPTVPANVELKYTEMEYDGDYCRVLTGYKREFDCVIIDGRDRVRCALNCLGALKDDGVVIWDDSHRERYQEGCVYFEKQGFRRLDFWGFSPLETQETCTTIFYRDKNCLGI